MISDSLVMHRQGYQAVLCRSAINTMRLHLFLSACFIQAFYLWDCHVLTSRWAWKQWFWRLLALLLWQMPLLSTHEQTNQQTPNTTTQRLLVWLPIPPGRYPCWLTFNRILCWSKRHSRSFIWCWRKLRRSDPSRSEKERVQRLQVLLLVFSNCQPSWQRWCCHLVQRRSGMFFSGRYSYHLHHHSYDINPFCRLHPREWSFQVAVRNIQARSKRMVMAQTRQCHLVWHLSTYSHKYF